ncbi:hypothetical protein [Longimicrobium sp.]|uniref:hypothetical protein n=1 Tax=Longimicrobium sp. TaxID=2029185 RepID=UPI003B3BACC9
MSPSEGRPRKRRRWLRGILWFFGGAATLIGLIVSFVLATEAAARKREIQERRPGRVVAKEWSREIVLLERRWREDEGWEVPDSGEVVRSERRIRDTVRVQVGTETVMQEKASRNYRISGRRLRRGETTYDTVAGEVAVYRTDTTYAPWYVYRVAEWVPADTLLETARTDTGTWRAPVWPSIPAAARSRPVYSRIDQYAVIVEVEGHTGTFPGWMRQPAWEGYTVGQKVAWGGGVMHPDSLAACLRWHQGRGEPPPDSLGCSPRRAPAR